MSLAYYYNGWDCYLGGYDSLSFYSSFEFLRISLDIYYYWEDISYYYYLGFAVLTFFLSSNMDMYVFIESL